MYKLKDNKKYSLSINISSSFMARVRCKKCGMGPRYYYTIGKPFLLKDVSKYIIHVNIFRKWIKRMTDDWYLDNEPKYFNTINVFSFFNEQKSYAPSLHKNRGMNINPSDYVSECVTCECSATVWFFDQKSIKKRFEILHRKGKYSFR